MTEITQTEKESIAMEDEQEDLAGLADSDEESECFGMDDDCYFDFIDSDNETKDSVLENSDVNQNLPKYSPFEMLDEVPTDHSFGTRQFRPVDTLVFNCAMQSERTMMQKDLPEGVFVKFFENRLDLCTAMIKGPHSTPYEDCLFFFDVQVSTNYPHSAPKVKYLSYCNAKLNPNLYNNNGTVCLSLLGTWSGSAEECWSAKKSSLLQLFVSIQGLILVAEPFYNEPAYHMRKGTMTKDSEKYNETVLKLVLESMQNQINKPPKCFSEQLLDHYRSKGLEIHDRFETLIATPESAPFPVSMDLRKSEIQCLLRKFKAVVLKLRTETPPEEPSNTKK